MSVIRKMTLRQMRAERTRTGLTLLEITIASSLLSAVLMGGISLAGTIYPEVHDMAAWKDVIDRSPLALLVLMATAVMAVPLLLATAFLIRSAFTVSLSQRVRALGQLASVGATRRQLQASVYWEALFLGAVAIPAGMVCAALGLWITFSALNRVDAVARLLGDLDALFVAEIGQSIPNTLHLSVSPLGLLLCALWSGLMLFLAAQRPARTAFRVEPLETFSPARRAFSAYRARSWHMERPAEPQLARRSRAQNRTRHWTLCAGMAVSLALIVTAAGFSSGLREAYRLAEQPYDSRWFVWGLGGAHPQEMLAQAAQLFPDTPNLRTEIQNIFFLEETSGKTGCNSLFILEDEDFEAWYGTLLTPIDDKVPVVLSQSDSFL